MSGHQLAPLGADLGLPDRPEVAPLAAIGVRNLAAARARWGVSLALTVRQPWASTIAAAAVVSDAKLTENRSWYTSHRGPLALHAGRAWDEDGDTDAVRDVLRRAGWRRFSDLPRGDVIAIVWVGDCHRERDGCCPPWGRRHAPFHWSFSDVRALEEPEPMRGYFKLWALPDSEIDGYPEPGDVSTL